MMTPIATKELLPYIPHRPPMVWVDTVLTYSPEGGTSITILTKNRLFMTQDQLRPSAAIELIAQAFAFNNAATLKMGISQISAAKKAFLASIKNFKIHSWPEIPMGSEILINVKKERQLGSISMIKGSCYFQDQLLASGELKVFAE